MGVHDKKDVVYSRDAKRKGVLTGASYKCTMEGCLGLREGVRWSDGRIAYPCSKGMVPHRGGRRIL